MDRYKKLKIVGRGAHGLVFLCERTCDGTHVILKEVPVSHLTPEEQEAALNEVKVISIFKHPNIVAYYESFIQESTVTIVMEYADGGNLHDFLVKRNGHCFSQTEVIELFAQLVLGLNHIHSLKVLHRDLKTHNILVNYVNGQPILKISDFGISKVLSSFSQTNTFVGTPSYLSPELCQGKPYDERSDMWALGCILHEMLTFKKAFEAPSLAALVVKIMQGYNLAVGCEYDSGIWQLVSDLLSANPLHRPTTGMLLSHPILAPTFLTLALNMGRIIA